MEVAQCKQDGGRLLVKESSRAVSGGNVTPTAIQSLPVSWPRRFERNNMNVFSLISIPLL